MIFKKALEGFYADMQFWLSEGVFALLRSRGMRLISRQG